MPTASPRTTRPPSTMPRAETVLEPPRNFSVRTALGVATGGRCAKFGVAVMQEVLPNEREFDVSPAAPGDPHVQLGVSGNALSCGDHWKAPNRAQRAQLCVELDAGRQGEKRPHTELRSEGRRVGKECK